MARFVTSPSLEVELEEGATVEELLEMLGVPEKVAVSILVNGASAPLAQGLKGDDRVEILPMIAGGSFLTGKGRSAIFERERLEGRRIWRT